MDGAFIAHIRASDGVIQTVEEHLLDVKKLAERAGEKVGLAHVSGLAGMLHDMGKFTNRFKKYILQAVNDPENPPKRGEVDHSTAGGRLLHRRYHEDRTKPFHALLAEIVGNAIISHHGNLHDFLSPELESPFLRRVKEKELLEYKEAEQRFFQFVINEQEFDEYVDQAASELQEFIMKYKHEGFETMAMFTSKFIFSVLVDADRTNTRLFEENKLHEQEEETEPLFPLYYERLMEKMISFEKHKDAGSPINQLRREMAEQCEVFAEKPSGIYTLSIPTGGGKTLASLRYALKHAIKYNKKRIVYVVPFTTIIEQNAETVRAILQDDESILEHHSNVTETEDKEEQDGIMSRQEKLKLARDNWDVPIIFTTMVQFLNTFYAKGNRNTRRLHQLSEAVIIFDEVQKVPIRCVSLFNKALNFLTEAAHSSVVLCTATQPALDFVEHQLNIKSESEMIRGIDEVAEAFKRVELSDMTAAAFNTDTLASFIYERMDEVDSVLVILNTKTVVKRLFEHLKEELGEDVHLFHLSTSMCAAHRADILEKIRKCLEQNKRVICLSTQLIEAGVDVSFQCVIRSVAGLDSIAQAAGRCNRHGEYGIKTVYIIDHEEENLDKLKEIKIGKKIVLRMLKDMQVDSSEHGGSLLSREAMERYFKRFYKKFELDLDYPVSKIQNDHLVGLLTRPADENDYKSAYTRQSGKGQLPLFLANSYATAADYFQVIDQRTDTVLVPYGEGQKLIAELSGDQSIEDYGRLMRKAQQFSVNIYAYEKQQLIQEDGLVSLMNGTIWALREGAYDKKYGLNINNSSSPGDFLSM
ncbi:CRISPR-associated helicase/endonuclease Cas3 [Domibacillus antri]|uniref:CRISPR-associated helicase/endonuclease Cas3 n=1 Tax=Domibacillus antri TaxID=1714264 RepID=A0A1Q8Q501_9BACI|nr:CRISPR-associated helicase/endonuclease Cas3 [Domibacillus antri]